MREEVGSTASTATLWPRSVRDLPRLSIKVLLPTPGTPVIPTRWESPVSDISALSNS